LDLPLAARSNIGCKVLSALAGYLISFTCSGHPLIFVSFGSWARPDPIKVIRIVAVKDESALAYILVFISKFLLLSIR
jgi:hypothetical protein